MNQALLAAIDRTLALDERSCVIYQWFGDGSPAPDRIRSHGLLRPRERVADMVERLLTDADLVIKRADPKATEGMKGIAELARREQRVYYRGGQRCVERDGQWVCAGTQNGPYHVASPFWMLEILKGFDAECAVAHDAADHEVLRGLCDLVRAASAGGRLSTPPLRSRWPHPERLFWRRLPTVVTLHPGGGVSDVLIEPPTSGSLRRQSKPAWQLSLTPLGTTLEQAAAHSG